MSDKITGYNITDDINLKIKELEDKFKQGDYVDVDALFRALKAAVDSLDGCCGCCGSPFDGLENTFNALS